MSDATVGHGADRLFRSLAAVAAALIMLPLALPPPAAVAALAIAFAWLPGALAVDLLRTPREPGERVLAALALSPAISGGASTLLLSAHVPAALAVRFLAALLFIGAVTRAMWPRDWTETPSDPTAGDRTLRAPALLWALIVLAFLLGNAFLPPRSDGWFHAAVTQQIGLRGLPVEDPSFAGLRLLSFWVTDVWAAMWIARAPQLAVWTPLIALNLAAALAAILAVCALARRLGATRGGQWLAAGLAVLGYSPFAWGWVALRAATGQVRGIDELRRLAGSGVETALNSLSIGQLHASLATFADKFLVLTPFGLGLALFALLVMTLRDAAEDRGAGTLLAVALVAAATPLTHTAVGMSALAFAGAWWIFEFVRDARRRGRLLGVAAALIGGALVSVPYLLGVAHGRRESTELGFSAPALGSLLLGGALLVPAAFWAALRLRTRLPIANDLLLGMTVFALLGLFVQLPGSNQSKLFNQLFLIAAPPAALAFIALATRCAPSARAALALALCIATIPTAVLAGWGFVSERGQSLESWRPPSTAVADGWRWLRAHTAADCVVVDEGGAREPMVLAARSALAPGASFERRGGYRPEEIELRHRASRELSARGPISEPTDSLLRTLRREVVVVQRGPDAPGDLRFAETDASDTATTPDHAGPRSTPRYVPIHEAGPIAYWRVDPAPR